MLNLTALADEQQELAKSVKRFDNPPYRGSILTGLDVAYSESTAAGCAIVMNCSTNEVLESVSTIREIESDYIPGFFQLREGPVLIDLVQRIKKPGIILVDGNGILHPRQFGLASYLGLKMDVQTIGVAKRLIFGIIGARSGNSADVMHRNEVLGRVLWLNRRKPLYVSIGHRVSLDTAVNIVITSSTGSYPDVLRRAHTMSKDLLAKQTG